MRTTVKTCFKCGAEKPLTDFYKHPMMGDGHLGKCKECAKNDVRQNYERNIEYFREYDKQRFRASPKRRAQLRNLFSARTPEQRAAHTTFGNAVRDGKIKRPEACWHCGSTGRIEGHHADYSSPLDVVWLCRSCHVKAHKQLRSA